jgi:hypothetical protein
MKYSLLMILVCCTAREMNQSNAAQNNLGVSIVSNPKKIYRLKKSSEFFSSPIRKDTFILELNGEYLTKSKIIFRIISFQSEIIYEEQFDMMALYGFGPDVTKPKPDSITVEKYLVERFENFFNSDSFLKPAIKESTKYEELYNSVIPEEEWRQIKAKPESIAFVFTLWEESISYIVYSEKRKKAIVYQVCC